MLVHTRESMDVGLCVHVYVYAYMCIGVHVCLDLYFTQFHVARSMQPCRESVVSIGFVALEPDVFG